MNPFIYAGIGVSIALFGAYTMAIQGATLYWGARLFGFPTEEDLIKERLAAGDSLPQAKGYALGASHAGPRPGQDAITPRAQTRRLVLHRWGRIGMLVLGIVMYPWYWGFVGMAGTFVLTAVFMNFFPKENSRHFRDLLFNDLKQRKENYLSQGDSLRAGACADLIERFQQIP